MYYVYVLKNSADFYIGYTEDLRRRLKQHQLYNDANLLYYEAYVSKKLAMSRERKLKYYGSAWRSLKKRITA